MDSMVTVLTNSEAGIREAGRGMYTYKREEGRHVHREVYTRVYQEGPESVTHLGYTRKSLRVVHT